MPLTLSQLLGHPWELQNGGAMLWTNQKTTTTTTTIVESVLDLNNA